MEEPSNRRLVILTVIGFTIAISEPVVLLALGDDLAGAFWPMAIRSLEWTMFLREWRTGVFAILLVLTPTVFVRCNNSGSWEKVIACLLLGLFTGLTVIFSLLNMAYLRDAFILLPTTYGFIILFSVLIIG